MSNFTVKQSHVEQTRPRGNAGNFITLWPPARIAVLRNLVDAGYTSAEIAEQMSTPEKRLSPTTIRVRLHRLGWVAKRKRPINRVKKQPNAVAAVGRNAAAE